MLNDEAFDSTTGKKMSIAMGLIDSITTSVLQSEPKYEPNFSAWLTSHVKKLTEKHLTFDPMLTTFQPR